ncbi:hypothetical protein ACIREO_08985 [Streptomyces sp. NPDC102441]|uniref:hypothetical protein n=1 Tax=Streptomyces sp. NPDC102441 TaxID=3366176 RepID=UPI00382B549A
MDIIMTLITRSKITAAAVIGTGAIALPLATASTASAETNLRPHWADSMLECQTMGNTFAQQGLLNGFTCVKVNSNLGGPNYLMYPW